MARVERVEYECDECGRTTPARVVDTPGGEQAVVPTGWFALEVRHARHQDDKAERVKLEVCSVECATAQLELTAGER